MDNCEKHKKEIAGISDMKVLAEMIGDLHYESLTEFLDRLCDKLLLDAAKDRAKGRKDLANVLEYSANHIYEAHVEMETAWQISKPFMKS